MAIDRFSIVDRASALQLIKDRAADVKAGKGIAVIAESISAAFRAVRALMPVTTAVERYQAQNYVAEGQVYPCMSCGKHGYNEPTVCYWCKKAR